MYIFYVNNKMINLIVYKYKFNFFEDICMCIFNLLSVFRKKNY